jgi:shikimate dehydrogenase
LLLGAGGAGSAIAAALLEAGVSRLVIHDAAPSRAATLVNLLADLGRGRVRGRATGSDGFDLVFNATPLGLTEGDPPPVDTALLTPSMFVGDVIAGHGVTPYIAAARAAGCATVTGGHMIGAVQDLMANFLLDT